MNYQDNLKRHLSDYKRLDFGIEEPGTFRYRGRDVLRHHILPIEHSSRNLFEEAQAGANAFLAANPDKKHRYFHHLNSSQAFVFNLFFPYFSGAPESASSLLRALGQQGMLGEWEPEAVPVPAEETNVDVYWKTLDGTSTICEVKLSESDFGRAKDNAKHRAKLIELYSGPLAQHLEKGRLERLAFFNAYQFNRNIWHMARVEGCVLIFLLPQSNTSLWGHLHKLLLGVTPATRARISVVAIEDVIGKLSNDQQCPEPLREYAKKLGRKYLPTMPSSK